MVTLKEIKHKTSSKMRLLGNLLSLLILAVIGMIAIVIIFENSFFTQIQSYEKGVLFTFGKASSKPVPTGLQWHLPYPFQHIEVVNVEKERVVQIGFRMDEATTNRTYMPREALVITSDGNLVDMEVEANYHINNIHDYVLNVENPDQVVQVSTEAALKSIIGQYTLDEILTVKKFEATTEVKERLQKLLDFYNVGVTITRVQFIKVLNPLKVREAFESVESAKTDSSISVEQALAYRNKVIPEARGLAEKKIKGAEAYAISRISKAEADTMVFNSLVRNYRNSKEVTRKRLYLETLEEVLPGKKKVIVDAKGNTLNLLNLGDAK
jgi:membrane protease subunit HflK